MNPVAWVSWRGGRPASQLSPHRGALRDGPGARFEEVHVGGLYAGDGQRRIRVLRPEELAKVARLVGRQRVHGADGGRLIPDSGVGEGWGVVHVVDLDHLRDGGHQLPQHVHLGDELLVRAQLGLGRAVVARRQAARVLVRVWPVGEVLKGAQHSRVLPDYREDALRRRGEGLDLVAVDDGVELAHLPAGGVAAGGVCDVAEGVAVYDEGAGALLVGEGDVAAREGVALPDRAEDVDPAPLHRDHDGDFVGPRVRDRGQARDGVLLLEVELRRDPRVLHRVDG